MATAILGNPEVDRNVIESFEKAVTSLSTVITAVLYDKGTLRNLGQDTLDEIEVLLREARVEIDRGLIAFGTRRTIRTKQGIGGAVGMLRARVAKLEVGASPPQEEDGVSVAESEVVTPVATEPEASEAETQL